MAAENPPIDRADRAAELELEAQRKNDEEEQSLNKRRLQESASRAIAGLAKKLQEYKTKDDAQELAHYIIAWIIEGEIEHVALTTTNWRPSHEPKT